LTALAQLAALLKRQGRRAEAVALWEQWAAAETEVAPFEELAKFYEWHEVNIARAIEYVERALLVARQHRLPGAIAALQYRWQRLQRKRCARGETTWPRDSGD